jgi:hypothetical protein
MDSYREHPSDFEPAGADAQPDREVALGAGGDERRMHVRAYNYWVSLLDGRDFPSIEDLEPEDLNDYSSNSVLLDFTCGRDNPATPYIGSAVREECGIADEIRTISEVPSRSLLSRLTDHYMQIIANRAPVGFEAEFENQRGESICYRGILMPFSSDGDTIDFIYGVINWKSSESTPRAEVIVPQVALAEPVLSTDEVEEDPDCELPIAEPQTANLTSKLRVGGFAPVAEAGAAAVPPEWTSGLEEAGHVPSAPQADPGASLPAALDVTAVTPTLISIPGFEDQGDETDDLIPGITLDEEAALADRLWAARETAEVVKSADGRSRAALYSALALAYDFAIAAQNHPGDYAELLQESGVKAQARAPMTPIVKLVFGIDYDKTRLTEFASALSYGQRNQVELGGFAAFIDKQPGGLKGLVAAERQARRPETKIDSKLEAGRARLRDAVAISLTEIDSPEEFALVVTRRNADGTHQLVALIDDAAMVERAIRRAA